METINDVLRFLNKLEVAFCPSREDPEKLVRVIEILTNFFQDSNSEKLESMLQNVREIKILSGVGDWCEILDVVKILRKDTKFLQTQLYDWI